MVSSGTKQIDPETTGVVGGRTIGKSNVVNRESHYGSTYRVNWTQPPPLGHARFGDTAMEVRALV